MQAAYSMNVENVEKECCLPPSGSELIVVFLMQDLATYCMLGRQDQSCGRKAIIARVCMAITGMPGCGQPHVECKLCMSGWMPGLWVGSIGPLATSFHWRDAVIQLFLA